MSVTVEIKKNTSIGEFALYTVHVDGEKVATAYTPVTARQFLLAVVATLQAVGVTVQLKGSIQ